MGATPFGNDRDSRARAAPTIAEASRQPAGGPQVLRRSHLTRRAGPPMDPKVLRVPRGTARHFLLPESELTSCTGTGSPDGTR